MLSNTPNSVMFSKLNRLIFLFQKVWAIFYARDYNDTGIVKGVRRAILAKLIIKMSIFKTPN